jgi:hypothetical protein
MEEKDNDKDKVKELSNLDFIYQAKTITIPCSGEEKLKEIFQRFVDEINQKKGKYIINEFAFLYEGKKLNDDSKMIKDIIIQNKKNIIVKRKLRIIKCPLCFCNDSIINLNDYHISFYDCKYDHKNRIYLLNEYDKSQEVDFSQISCSKSDCKATMSNDNNDDFYKCLTCTKKIGNTLYFCSKHISKEEHKTHKKVRYDDKNYYCEKHFSKFIEYCFSCTENLCQDCSKDHQVKNKNHQIISYDSLAPNIDNIRNDLKNIKKKMDKLEIFINNIKNSLDGAFKLYDNYYKIANDITEKYELYMKDLKNYRILRNFLNLKISNRNIIGDLDKILSADGLGNKSIILINKYKEERGKYNNTPNLNLEKHGKDDYDEWIKENAIKNNQTQK